MGLCRFVYRSDRCYVFGYSHVWISLACSVYDTAYWVSVSFLFPNGIRLSGVIYDATTIARNPALGRKTETETEREREEASAPFVLAS